MPLCLSYRISVRSKELLQVLKAGSMNDSLLTPVGHEWVVQMA